MRFRAAVAADLLDHARSGYPAEVCGVLLCAPDGAIVASARLTNREEEQPRARFRIDPLDQLRAERDARGQGLEIGGYYHSHPDHPARPSETDRRIAAEGLSDRVLHVVVAVSGAGEATLGAWIFREARRDFEPEPFQIEG